MSNPPPSESPPAARAAVFADDGDETVRRWRPGREFLFVAAGLLCGFALTPLLIFLVGSHFLGPYTHGSDPTPGGALTLYGDFYAALGHGSLIYWGVGLGPLVMLILARALIRSLARRA